MSLVNLSGVQAQCRPHVAMRSVAVSAPLVLEQPVMHLPEPVLCSCGLRGFGRELRACGCTSVSGRCRQTYRRSPWPARSPADHGLGLAAVRALEVAVLDERDRCLAGPRMWSRSGSTGTARSVIVSAVPSSARSRSRFGSKAVARNTGQPSPDAHIAAAKIPPLPRRAQRRGMRARRSAERR